MSYRIDDNGEIRNTDSNDHSQRLIDENARLKAANAILLRQLGREQERRRALESQLRVLGAIGLGDAQVEEDPR
jgi:hypothetical protein